MPKQTPESKLAYRIADALLRFELTSTGYWELEMESARRRMHKLILKELTKDGDPQKHS